MLVQSTNNENIDDTEAKAISTPPVSPLLMSSLTDGRWTIAGVSWQLRTSEIPVAELAASLSAPPQNPAHTNEAYKAPSSEQFSAQQTVRLIRAMGGARKVEGEFSVWRIDHPDLRARAFFSADDSQLLLVRACWPESPTTWRLIEGKAAAGLAEDVANRSEQPPLPDGVEVIATRFDESGRIWANVVASSRGVGPVYALWKEAGWRISFPPASVTTDMDTKPFLIEKDGKACLVQHFAGEVGTTTLIITAVPE